MERDEAAKSGLATLDLTHFDYKGLILESENALEATVKLYRKIFHELGVTGRVAFYGMEEQGSRYALLKTLDEALGDVTITGEYDNDIFAVARATKGSDEIERMRRDAQVHDEEDKRKREEVELHNSADQLIYQTEKQVKEFGDKLSDDDKSRLEKEVEQLKQANAGSNTKDIQDAIDSVNRVWSDLATKMYADTKAGEEGKPQEEVKPESGGTGDDDEIEDADFEVVDDKK